MVCLFWSNYEHLFENRMAVKQILTSIALHYEKINSGRFSAIQICCHLLTNFWKYVVINLKEDMTDQYLFFVWLGCKDTFPIRKKNARAVKACFSLWYQDALVTNRVWLRHTEQDLSRMWLATSAHSMRSRDHSLGLYVIAEWTALTQNAQHPVILPAVFGHTAHILWIYSFKMAVVLELMINVTWLGDQIGALFICFGKHFTL